MSRAGKKYAFGPFEMDVAEGLLLRDGQPVPLTAKAFDLLTILLASHGHLVDKQEMLRQVWGEAFVEEAVLSVNIAAIRRALTDNSHVYIETVQKRGYRFIAPVREIAPEPGGVANAATPGGAELARSASRRWLWVGLAAVVLLGVGVETGRRALRPALGTSVAVLPLKSLSDDKEQQHFADAMTDLLLTDLGRIPQLRVVSRQSVMQYQETKKTVPEIARELNVAAIVEGTVRREGQRVRITAQLIHGPSDRHLWAQSYERDLSDTLALQQDVAESIAREIGVALVPGKRREAPRVAPAAYEAFLRGMSLLDGGSSAKAADEFRKAIAEDPRYAPAYTKLAGAYFGRAFFGGAPPSETWPAMKDAALQAIELDASDAEAHAWLAIEKLHYEWDWAGAEREFQRSLELNPSDTDVRHNYAHYLLTVGRSKESLAQMDRAFETDPVGLGAAT